MLMRWSDLALLGCSLLSLHFLCGILTTHPTVRTASLELSDQNFPERPISVVYGPKVPEYWDHVHVVDQEPCMCVCKCKYRIGVLIDSPSLPPHLRWKIGREDRQTATAHRDVQPPLILPYSRLFISCPSLGFLDFCEAALPPPPPPPSPFSVAAMHSTTQQPCQIHCSACSGFAPARPRPPGEGTSGQKKFELS